MQLLGRSRRPRESTVLPWRVRLEQEQASRSQRSNERRGTRVGDVCVSRPSFAFPSARKREHGAKEQYAAAASSKQQSPAPVSAKDRLHSDKNAAARWVEAQSRWQRRFDELVLFRKKNGYNFETMNCSDKMAYCCELYWWTQNQRQVHRNGIALSCAPFLLVCRFPVVSLLTLPTSLLILHCSSSVGFLWSLYLLYRHLCLICIALRLSVSCGHFCSTPPYLVHFPISCTRPAKSCCLSNCDS